MLLGSMGFRGNNGNVTADPFSELHGAMPGQDRNVTRPLAQIADEILG
jgi:hypothetical protein